MALPLTRLQQIARGLYNLLANDIVARSAAWEVRRRSGMTPTVAGDLVSQITNYLKEYSTPDGYIKTVATGVVTTTLNENRDEVLANADIARWGYSAILDTNTCGPCRDADGMEGKLEDLPPVPNPECEGGLKCRCIHYAVMASEDAAKA